MFEENQIRVEIKDEDRALQRTFFTDHRYVKPDMTVTLFAFKLRSGEEGLSVDIERLTTYEKNIVNEEKYRLFALQVRFIRTIGLDCVHGPIVHENYAHAEIFGEQLKKRFVSRALAKNAVYDSLPCLADFFRCLQYKIHLRRHWSARPHFKFSPSVEHGTQKITLALNAFVCLSPLTSIQ